MIATAKRTPPAAPIAVIKATLGELGEPAGTAGSTTVRFATPGFLGSGDRVMSSRATALAIAAAVSGFRSVTVTVSKLLVRDARTRTWFARSSGAAWRPTELITS